MKKILIAVEIVLIVLLGAFLFFVYSGRYNIAAADEHYGIVRWAFETTMKNSVRRQAQGIAVPSLEGSDLRQGGGHFDRMCVLCHGAPGIQPSEIGRGQVPRPPDLTAAVQEWTPAELFWIVKNGIKMSGMPAFGGAYKDEEIWTIVAFSRRLPHLSAADYRALAVPLRPEVPTAPLQPEHDEAPPSPDEKPAGGARENLQLPEDAEIETAHQ